ncbi:MAG: hypothetical protein AB7S74_07325 [Hyphomicrobium sp.]
MLISLTSTAGAAVLVNVDNIVRAAPAPAASGAYELWLTNNERILIREDAAAILKAVTHARG